MFIPLDQLRTMMGNKEAQGTLGDPVTIETKDEDTTLGGAASSNRLKGKAKVEPRKKQATSRK